MNSKSNIVTIKIDNNHELLVEQTDNDILKLTLPEGWEIAYENRIPIVRRHKKTLTETMIDIIDHMDEEELNTFEQKIRDSENEELLSEFKDIAIYQFYKPNPSANMFIDNARKALLKKQDEAMEVLRTILKD
jgi:hypothetical protein